MRTHLRRRRRKRKIIWKILFVLLIISATSYALVATGIIDLQMLGIKPQKKKATSVTQTDANIEELPEVDSTQLKMRMEDAKIAYSKIRFGMTKREVQQVYGHATQQIGEFTYILTPFYTKEGKLYSLHINSQSEYVTLFDTTVKKAWKNLKDILEAKYGASEKSTRYPLFIELKNDQYQFTDTWIIESKKISLGIQAEKSRYSAAVVITDLVMQAKVNEEESKKTLEAKVRAAQDF
ncbi:hypothetical protein Q0590_30225 [Rhodocytophaga aerolata]|uniref:Uncharacterized protein n=1 Tax=Rhodocytophaga aerolata TaxID=455078 RepID=A0ABT8RER2_9BACT|nr:hypothetical protein [Rhodocytophaga aerolata]MDO1450590.1 hypothetical protein [Rhodocytophaga aerolata]